MNEDLTQSYVNQLNKQTFKSKYKFIDFKKSNETASISAQETTNENLKEFYEDLVETTTITETKDIIVTECVLKPTNKPQLKQYTDADYLKAAQNNNFQIIDYYLTNDKTRINVKDDYNWNALMIAVTAHNNKIVEYFFEKHSDNEQFSDFVNSKDSAGNSPESLAIKMNNLTALKIIKNSNRIIKKTQPKTSQSKQINEYKCDICITKTNESELEHLKSMAHLLTQNELEPKKEISFSYHLRSNNKGYQLLCRSGWNEQSGLGRNEQGNKFPIKAKQKLDRQGIGIEPDDKDVNKPAAKTVKLETAFKDLKTIKKRNAKLKKMERNLRFEFNN